MGVGNTSTHQKCKFRQCDLRMGKGFNPQHMCVEYTREEGTIKKHERNKYVIAHTQPSRASGGEHINPQNALWVQACLPGSRDMSKTLLLSMLLSQTYLQENTGRASDSPNPWATLREKERTQHSFSYSLTNEQGKQRLKGKNLCMQETCFHESQTLADERMHKIYKGDAWEHVNKWYNTRNEFRITH